MEIITKRGTEKTNDKVSIIDFTVGCYAVSVFQGNLSPNDIIIKYREVTNTKRTRLRTPKHIHWTVDLLLKKQGNEELTNDFLKGVAQIWETCQPLLSNDYETLENLVLQGEYKIEIDRFSELDNYGEYSVKFLFVLLQLLAVQEKTNKSDAYMFGKVVSELKKNDLDIFSVVSTATMNRR